MSSSRRRTGQKGDIKRGLGSLIGNAGECLVIGELLRRRAVATLAPRNFTAFDVLVAGDQITAYIRVKTKTAAADSWVWNIKKNGAVFDRLKKEGDLTVLVDLPEPQEPPHYYIVPTVQLDKRLKDGFSRWLGQPPRNRARKPHDPKNKMRRIGYEAEDWRWLEQFRDRWELITSAASW